MDKIKSYKEKIIKTFSEKKGKVIYLIFLLGFVGILLISLSELFPEEKTSGINSEKQKTAVYEYENLLEERIETEISKISGAGKTSVLLTFDTSKEYFYAENSFIEENSEEKNTENELVIVDGEKGEEPVIIRTKEAKIRGILVICEGGDDPTVREKIIEALCALLDIPSNCVSVAKMA
ncbi:MAG: hypothetical protein IKU42_03175 [Oscillospiraceae bacterium]|nr:hypothetical protein [Oscillospiraceae bacterium]